MMANEALGQGMIDLNRRMMAAAKYAADRHGELVDKAIMEVIAKGIDKSRISLEQRPNGRTRVLVDTWPVSEVWIDFMTAENRIEMPPVL